MLRFQSYASGSSGNLYTVEDGQDTIMIECGLPWAQVSRAMGHRATTVSAVLVSHAHADHCRGLKGAIRYGLDCWMSGETAKALSLPGCCRIEGGDSVEMGSFMVQAFSTIHDSPGALGFVVTERHGGKLLYVTDSAYVPVKVNGLSIIAIEANFSLDKVKENVSAGVESAAKKHRIMWNHQSIDTVLKFLQETDRSRLQGVWLLHLSNANSDERAFKDRVAEATGVPVYIAGE